jgi:enoyl-CoA hydratase/carnithine racemase
MTPSRQKIKSPDTPGRFMDRGGNPSFNPTLNPDGVKGEFNATDPVDDVNNHLRPLSETLQQHGYSPDEATAAALTLLPDILQYDRTMPAHYPNGRLLTDDVFSALMIFMTHGQATPQSVGTHKDLVAVFPFLGMPHPEPYLVCAEPHDDSSLSNTREALMNSATKAPQVRLNRVTPSYCRVVLDNPPLNLMGPEFVSQMREIVTALENDDRVKVVVFESAVDGFFLNHSDFLAKFEDLTSIPQGPTGLEAWPDVLVRLTRAPFVSIALIRGRATGNGSELALACDMSFASRERALLSQWEVGVGLVAGGGPMARLPRVMGRGRALEVLLSADDVRGADAELLGYVNRALPDAELDNFVDALATRIASFDKWAIANTKRLVNEASLPPDVEIRAGWDACMASVKRPAAQERIKALLEQGLQEPGESENRLGSYVGQLALKRER